MGAGAQVDISAREISPRQEKGESNAGKRTKGQEGAPQNQKERGASKREASKLEQACWGSSPSDAAPVALDWWPGCPLVLPACQISGWAQTLFSAAH